MRQQRPQKERSLSSSDTKPPEKRGRGRSEGGAAALGGPVWGLRAGSCWHLPPLLGPRAASHAPSGGARPAAFWGLPWRSVTRSPCLTLPLAPFHR